MADDTKNRGPADRARVNVHEKWELTYHAASSIMPNDNADPR